MSFPPNRLQVGTLVFLGTAALTFLHARPILGWAYPDLAAAMAEFRQALLFVGIFVCSVAAFVASGISRPDLAHVPAGSQRRGPELCRSHVVFISLASALGFSAGLLPVVVPTYSRSTYDTVDWVVVAAGYAAVVFYVALGYLIGCLVPSFASVPAAVLASYSSLFFMPAVLSPIFSFDIVSGQEVPLRVELLRAVFFAAAALVMVVAASVMLRRRTPQDRRGADLAVTAVLAPVLLLVWAGRYYEGTLVTYDDATAECRTVQRVTACVHPAREALLGRWVADLSRVAKVAGQEVVPDFDVVDATLPQAGDSGSLPVQLQGQDAGRWREFAIADVVADLVGLQQCVQSESDADSDALTASSAAGAWLLDQAGIDPYPLLQGPESEREYSALLAMDVDVVQASIQRNLGDLKSCRAPLLSTQGAKG